MIFLQPTETLTFVNFGWKGVARKVWIALFDIRYWDLTDQTSSADHLHPSHTTSLEKYSIGIRPSTVLGAGNSAEVAGVSTIMVQGEAGGVEDLHF